LGSYGAFLANTTEQTTYAIIEHNAEEPYQANLNAVFIDEVANIDKDIQDDFYRTQRPLRIRVSSIKCQLGNGPWNWTDRDANKAAISFYARPKGTSDASADIWLSELDVGRIAFGVEMSAEELNISQWSTRIDPMKYSLVVNASWQIRWQLTTVESSGVIDGTDLWNASQARGSLALYSEQGTDKETIIWIEASLLSPLVLFTGVSAFETKKII
jgi:hypothetical protein